MGDTTTEVEWPNLAEAQQALESALQRRKEDLGEAYANGEIGADAYSDELAALESACDVMRVIMRYEKDDQLIVAVKSVDMIARLSYLLGKAKWFINNADTKDPYVRLAQQTLSKKK